VYLGGVRCSTVFFKIFLFFIFKLFLYIFLYHFNVFLIKINFFKNSINFNAIINGGVFSKISKWFLNIEKK
jgi:hypothetical protein